MQKMFFHLWSLFVRVWTGLIYSLPVQLLVNHLRHHKSLVVFWVFLMLVVSQNFLKSMGGPYLFLEPEYLNDFSPAAMFLLGISFGIFSLAFQLTSYILDGPRFYFLGEEQQAFLKFSLNNSLLPLMFWAVYIASFVDFQLTNPEMNPGKIMLYIGSAVTGGFSVSLIFGGYFWTTNTDLARLLRRTVRFIPRQDAEKEAKRLLYSNARVDYFLAALWKVKSVPKKVVTDKLSLLRILNQNHSNALVAECIILAVLILLGIFQEVSWVRIPAGAGFMMLFSFIMMLIGAVDYWFRRVGAVTLGLVLCFFYLLNNWSLFIGTDYAFGMDFQSPKVRYEPALFEKINTSAAHRRDSLAVIQILENWEKRWYEKYGYGSKPKMVVWCMSGGGHRSAVWTFRALQHLDYRSNGKLSDRTVWMSGASGGMIGAGYYRELLFRKAQGEKIDLYNPQYVDNISKDLLTPIVFNLATNMLFPSMRFEDSIYTYEKDRGYYFDKQLAENTGTFADRRLRDYESAEKKALIPMMVLSPSIVNDGRQLIISPQKLSFLMREQIFSPVYKNEVAAVDFGSIFADRQGGRLHFATALRMNATFPTLLPYVELPTEPRMEVADAGIIDNFGISLTAKYLHFFRQWINTRTDGVVLIQFRDTRRESLIPPPEPRTLFGKLGDVFGGTYLAFAESKDFANDVLLENLQDVFPGKFEVVDLQYLPEKKFQEASLSFHLTQREKNDILRSLSHPENVESFNRLEEILK